MRRERKRSTMVRHIYHCRDIRWHLCRAARVDKPPLRVNNSYRVVERVFNIAAIGPAREK